jgi:hypothetical protein
MKGRDEEALAALARLHAHGDTEDPLVKFEFEDILASIKAETPDTNPYVGRAAPSPLNGPAQFCRLTKTYPASVNNDPAHTAFVYMTWAFNFAFSSCIGPLSWAYPVVSRLVRSNPAEWRH